MEIFSAILILLTAVTGSSCLPSPCRDMDSATCIAMAKLNPNLCSDTDLASAVCPKYCKLCPLVCFNCTLVDAENQLCSQTKECSQGEQCMVRRLHATADGHSESVDAVCQYTGCSADITIMIEDSASRTSLQTAALIQFIKDTVSKLQIGLVNNKVSFTLFGSRSVNVQWKFDSVQSYNKALLLHALDSLDFKQQSGHDIAYFYIMDYLNKLSNHTFAKDRATADDIVIIFSENDRERSMLFRYHPTVDKIIYVSIAGDPFAGSFHYIAQHPQHVFSVPSYNDLQSIQTKLLMALCDPYDLHR